MPGRTEVLELVLGKPNWLWHKSEITKALSKDGKPVPKGDRLSLAVGNALQGLKDTGKLKSFSLNNYFFHTFWGPVEAFDKDGQPLEGWKYDKTLKIDRSK